MAKCVSCKLVAVQYGNVRVLVHENGCPQAWRSPRKCGCGESFTPKYQWQKSCWSCSRELGLV